MKVNFKVFERMVIYVMVINWYIRTQNTLGAVGLSYARRNQLLAG